jgi:hypothetical protein
MFTFLEFNPNSKNPVTFPTRLFTLPISTGFLFSWLFLSGLGAVFVLFESWIHFVPLPYVDVFGGYQKCLFWMTLLVLAQAITWSLSAWPNVRLLVLAALLVCFLGSPAWLGMFKSPIVLPTFLLLGAVLARAGLQKMRRGEWQGCSWRWPLPAMLNRGATRNLKRFTSPSLAQLWFEWRQFARTLCLYVFALTVIPVVLHLLARVVFGHPLQGSTLLGFTLCLIGIPVVTHSLAAASQGRDEQSFLMKLPLTSGEMTMALLKAAAISTALSWVFALASLGAMPMLGDFNWVLQSFADNHRCRGAILFGLIFLTWRSFVANLCFARSGNRWLVDIPILMVVAVCVGAITLAPLKSNDFNWSMARRFVSFVPSLLACLVAVKLLLAFVGFRVSLKRRLIAPSAVVGYLAVWILLVAALLTLVLTLVRPSKGWDLPWNLPLSLGVVLVVPLARIAFCPIALAHSRHT